MAAPDPRINPYRPDLAAKYLEGQVEATRFAEGTLYEVIEPSAFLRREALHTARLVSEALVGERMIVYEVTDEGWAWGQLETDGYVGWIAANALGKPGPAPTDKVVAVRTLVFPAPDIKLLPIAALPMGARVAVAQSRRTFRRHPFGMASAGRASCADHRHAAGLRLGRRKISWRALPVGRQDVVGPRLLGPAADRAAGGGASLPAR